MMQSDTEPKFCKDCEHYAPPAAFFTLYVPESCRHPGNMSKPDLVHGRSYPESANADLRKPEGNCGPDGAMFEAKPPDPQAQYVPPTLRNPPSFLVIDPSPPPAKFRFWRFLGF